MSTTAISNNKKIGCMVTNLTVHTLWQKVIWRYKVSTSLWSSANGPVVVYLKLSGESDEKMLEVNKRGARAAANLILSEKMSIALTGNWSCFPVEDTQYKSCDKPSPASSA